MFAIPIIIAAPFIYGLTSRSGTSLLVPTVVLLSMALLLGALTVWLARRVLEPAERLEETRRILEDAYDRARAEALRDTLTGLGNHRAFQEEMERQWAIAARTGRSMALALLDLDDFKRLNDSSGHAAGDLVLRQAATTMAAYTRRSDRAFRVGGDEFALILSDTDVDGAQVLVRRLLAACLDGEVGRGAANTVSFSAGISAGPTPALDRESLYRQADSALFWSKRHGRTCVTIYDSSHDSHVTERPAAELSAAVAQVAATGAIRAVFQPIFDLSTGAPRGYEGLVRPLPDSGFTDPGSLFEAAEATGRTSELDIACLNTVMETAARLRLPGSLTVNLSPRTLESDDFSVHALLRMIVRHGLDPRNIVVELTEREAVEDVDRLRRACDACRVAGIRLAADDVGAGQRRPAAAQPAPLRHRQDRPLAGPGRGRPRHLARGRQDAARPGRPLGRPGDRRGDRDTGAARGRPLARDRGRPGLPAGPSDRPSLDRIDRPAGPRQGRRLADRTIADDADVIGTGCTMPICLVDCATRRPVTGR